MSEKYRSIFLLGTVFCIILQTSAAVITDTTCTPGTEGDKKCQGVDPNAECQTGSSNCACKTGYTGTDPCTKQPITQVTCTPGNGNNGDAKCESLDENSGCPTAASTCKCKTGYTGTNTCTKLPITGITCTPGDNNEGDTKCQGVDTNAECPASTTKCACKTGYKVDPNDDTKCLLSITDVDCVSGDETDGDAKCQGLDGNSECPAGANKCACKTGYTGTDTCTKISITCTPGDNNEGDTKCQGVDTNAECPASTTKCACKTGYKVDPNDDTKCVLSITDVNCVSGDETDGDAKCQGLDGNSECPTGAKKCACKTGYTGTDTCSDESSADSVKVTTTVIAMSLLSFIVRRIM